MPDLRHAFQQASRDAQALQDRPDNPTLLRLYALYKQATDGDREAPRPGFFDVVGNAKCDAWEQLRGLKPEDAMRRYVELVQQLRG